MNEVFAYIRVSTKQQKTDRQLVAIKEYYPKLKEENIFEDKESGKDFNREKYDELKKKLREGDVLIIKSTDRLGRNKRMVKEELAWFKAKGVKLRILAIPTTLRTDLIEGQDWMMDMITNIIIEVYTSIDEYELSNIRERQQEGIDAAKHDKKRYPGGQPKKINRVMFEVVYDALERSKRKTEDANGKGVKKKKMTIKDGAKTLGVTRNTLRKRLQEYREYLETGKGNVDSWLE